MGRIAVVEYLTLDGVTEDPGPTGDFEQRGWTIPYWTDELGELQSELLFASDALLLGRTTYEEFAASWPSRSGDPFTDRMNSMPKVVASTRLAEPLEWNATLLKGDVVEEITKLKQADQNLLIYGSGTLVETLMQRKLIDLYRLVLYPLALGAGTRFFRDAGVKTALTLTDLQATSTGVVVLTYEQADNAADAAIAG
jgi:dihydrofolate reductase